MQHKNKDLGKPFNLLLLNLFCGRGAAATLTDSLVKVWPACWCRSASNLYQRLGFGQGGLTLHHRDVLKLNFSFSRYFRFT
jgi:hypothetical protein